MAEWNKDQARQVMADTVEVINQAATQARHALATYGEEMTEARGLVDELNRIVTELTHKEIATSRSTPWITRDDARKLISISGQLKQILDVASIVKVATDLTSQAKYFIELMNRVDRHWGQDAYQEGEWEQYLSIEQLLTINAWIAEARAEEGQHDA